MTVQISDWSDLDAVRNDLTADYELVNDLDQNTSGYSGIGDDFMPISADVAGRFEGTLDGQEHTIGDLVLSPTEFDEVGLFAQTISGATITDLTLSGVSTQSGVDGNAGALIGFSDAGTVERVVADVSMSGTSGRDGLGGLIGATESPTTVRDCVVTGSVDGDERVGGLVGNTIAGTVERCYSLAAVSGTDEFIGGLAGLHSSRASIARSYAAGSVDGPSGETGGLVAPDSGGDVTAAYWDVDATGQTDSGGGTGLSTGEMTGDAAADNMSPLGFGFDWSLVTSGENADADDYPLLRTVGVDRQAAPRTASITDYRVVPIALSAAASNDPDADGPTVTLSWTDSATGEDGYRVYRAAGTAPSFPDDFTQIAETIPDVETFADADVAFDTDYTYRVAAFDGAGDATPRASATVAVGSPGPFAIAIVDTNAPVGVGAELAVDVEITNQGDLRGDTDVAVDLTEQ